MDVSKDYARLDATDLADLVRRGEVSAAELVEAAIVQLERSEPKLTGMMEWTLDKAREEASGPLHGPFAGVPFLLKDICMLHQASPTTTAAAFGGAGLPSETASWSGASGQPG